MTFFTIKNIGLLLLLGVLVFPVGINQSYAQQFDVAITEPSTSPITPDIAVSAAQGDSGVISFLAITDDSTSFAELDITLDFVNDDVTNPASNLETQVMFEGSDIGRTGGPSDPDVIIMSEPLRFMVNDNAIVGVYNLEYTVTDTDANATTGRLIFTIIPNTAPTADDINIQILTRGSATIPFGDIVRDAESLFSGLDIEFSFDNDDTNLSEQRIDVTSGATEADGDDTFTVDAEDVVIEEQTDQFYQPQFEPRTIELTYTVTDTGGLSDTGTVNIFVVETITSTFDGNLDDRYFTVPITTPLVPFEIEFDGAQYRDLLNLETTFGIVDSTFNPLDVTLTSPIATGPQGGSLTFITNPSFSDFDATLTYTPAVNFIGIETFTYTGTLDRVIASGTFTFYVGVTCETTLNANVDFGELGVGVTSDTSLITITNEGDVPAQSLIAGANWVSVEDDSISTMDVGQTRYSVTETDGYDDKTPFTATPVNVGGEIAESESLDVFVQLLIYLIDETFRDLNTPTTQTITVTSFCSMDP